MRAQGERLTNARIVCPIPINHRKSLRNCRRASRLAPVPKVTELQTVLTAEINRSRRRSRFEQNDERRFSHSFFLPSRPGTIELQMSDVATYRRELSRE